MSEDTNIEQSEPLDEESQESAEVEQTPEVTDISTEEPAPVDISDPQPEDGAVPFTPLSFEESIREVESTNLLLDVSLPVSVELGRTSMLIKDLMEIRSGSVIELDKLVGEPVDLIVNDKKLAEGEVVVIEENFAVRITALIGSFNGRANRNRVGR